MEKIKMYHQENDGGEIVLSFKDIVKILDYVEDLESELKNKIEMKKNKNKNDLYACVMCGCKGESVLRNAGRCECCN